MLIIRFWMKFVKFNKYEKYLGERLVENSSGFANEKRVEVESILKVVKSMSRNTPWESKCMVRAISAKWFLKQQGLDSTIYFGVAKENNDKEEKLKAHAWLRLGDQIVLGGKGHEAFNVVNYYS